MLTYHIHIGGLVQGVGFRPFVCRLADEMRLNGRVNNSRDGVHIVFNSGGEQAAAFYRRLLESPPPDAIVTHHHMRLTAQRVFASFAIAESTTEAGSRNMPRPALLLTPDLAMCSRCKEEVMDPANRRYRYPFTTCLCCGPRYSLVKALPYDRERTTMAGLPICADCRAETAGLHDRRHYSQTNSCKTCAITMHLYKKEAGEMGGRDSDELLDMLVAALKQGRIVAVKGIGGYLLLCDACDRDAIERLRERKRRPNKPFALLYPDMAAVAADVHLRPVEQEALESKVAPIVLCRLKESPAHPVCTESIAPGLDKIGIMLPCSPLLLLIAQDFGRPLIATSGNVSGSPILYKDEDALASLFDVADYILSYDREITVPLDDSVLRFTRSGQRILLRRGRGLAPNYFPNPFAAVPCTVLGIGGELKSAFALHGGEYVYVSQYLGNQEYLESQDSYSTALRHMLGLLKQQPDRILVDLHPGYQVSRAGISMAEETGASLLAVQHHKAHFAAVLAENDLLRSARPVLGIVWDGNGYGEDGHAWGSEAFVFADNEMERVAHLACFPQLLGDKMSREPRLSALSLLKDLPDQQHRVKKYFSPTEWKIYGQLLEEADAPALLTSSMGRFLDGIAAILGVAGVNTYEGEAAMRLEALAETCTDSDREYPLPLRDGCLQWRDMLEELLEDLRQGVATARIARNVFRSLATSILTISDHLEIDHLAFSGGVFQNALLTDMIISSLSHKKYLYFHRQLSPNDECIGFGQVAYFNQIKNQTNVSGDTGKDRERHAIPG